MFSSAWVRFGLLLVAAGFIAAATTPAISREPRAYGQRLVAQYQLPPESIARYAAMAAGAAPNASLRDNTMFADRSPWVGPKQRASASASQNPYTLVFTVSGVAKAAGEVYAQWQAGWEIHESQVASRELLMAVPRVARTGLAAGQALSLTASTTRVSFRGEREVAPMLGLVQARNLDINDVQVQVWSGAAPQAWPVLPWSPTPLLALGMTCLLVGSGLRYWQPVVRVPGMQPARSLVLPRLAPARPVAAVCVEPSAPREAPIAAAPSQAARVVAALHHVLTVGLTVHTVLDESRMRQRRAVP